jgi:hypothetical protein
LGHIEPVRGRGACRFLWVWFRLIFPSGLNLVTKR